jgi:hypothetical protein
MKNRGQIMTEEERNDIINWVCSNFFNQKMSSEFRKLQYTFSLYDTSVPIAIWRIKNRIIYRENLYNYMTEPIGSDVLVIHLKGGGTRPHRDSNLGEFKHIRFNVGIQIPESSSVAVYDGYIADIREGQYVMCRSGLDVHGVDENTSDIPRIIISFGFLIPEANITKTSIIGDISTKSRVKRSANIFFNKNKINTDFWPTPFSVLSFISYFCKIPGYGLHWWKTGNADVETLREYIEHGSKV